jgi:hypothetical protein
MTSTHSQHTTQPNRICSEGKWKLVVSLLYAQVPYMQATRSACHPNAVACRPALAKLLDDLR